MPLSPNRHPRRTRRNARPALILPFLWLATASTSTPAPGQTADAPGPATTRSTAPPRRVPDALNFANGLFRERRYELAAQQYERFLRDAKPGPDAAEARFGLANARLFQGEYAKARKEFETFLAEAPDHPNLGTAWYRVGETAYMLGDLAAARKAFETFTQNYPGHKHLDTAWPYLGDVCLRVGDLPPARKAYETSLSAHPEGRLADRARFGLGRTQALMGDPAAALQTFTTLAEKGGRDWADRAWFQIGQIHEQTKDYEKALSAYAKVESASPQSPLVPESRLHRAEALTKLDKREDAEKLLTALVEEAPSNLAAQAAFALGTSRLESNRAAEALPALDEATKRFEKTPMAAALAFRSAEAAMKLGKPDDARARYLKAASADPKDPWADDAMLRAARLALDQRDPADAARLADVFVTRFPTSPLKADARLVAARAQLASNQPKEAIATLSASLAEDKPGPSTAEAQRYYLGLAYRADGQSAKAAEVLDALAKTPAGPIVADAQFMLGQGHIEAKRFAEAIPALEKYLESKPDGDVADYALAHLVMARLELNEPEPAAKALEQLASRFPKSKTLAPTRVRLAEAMLTKKKYDEAAEQFSKAAEAPEVDPAVAARARLGLGWARLDGGKPAEAAEAFAAFLAASPDDPLAPEASLAQGRGLEAAKQVDPALQAYEQTAAKYPNTEPALLAALARARLLVEAKRPGDAASAYEQFTKDHPDYKPKDAAAPGLDAVLADWGWALVDAGKSSEADAVFGRLLKDFPESPFAADARFNLAESANQSKNLDEVVKLLGPLVAEGSKASPRLVQSALYRLGRTQAEKKDWANAARTLDRLLTEFPDNTFRREARLLRAEVALESGETAQAETALDALKTGPGEPSDPPGFAAAVKRRRIESLLALKKWKEVIEAADSFKKESPDDPKLAEVEFARARALQQMARFDEARAAYQTVIDARKAGDLVARSQFMIGETYFHQKDYHEAILQLLRVDILYDAPTWQAAALLEVGKAHEQLSQWADAAETYKRLREKFPDDPNAAEAKGRLETVQKRLDAGGPAESSAGGGGESGAAASP
ncbi:MAG: tetratricopeptide repeat protein [Isosphaeraceae bacterium]